MSSLALLFTAALLSGAPLPGHAPGVAFCARGQADKDQGARALLTRALAEAGIQLDLKHAAVVLPASVLVRRDLLEYVLVGDRGQMHESMFHTGVRPSLLNTALLALGLEQGANARYEEIAPAPTVDETGAAEEGERSLGRPQYRVLPPVGDGLLLYVAWRAGDEVYLYRIEDLISNLAEGRAMRRHRWVFLGSRFVSLETGEPETFVADREGNLINVSFFFQGNTLLTAALEECVEQTIWAPNFWLLPPREAPVAFVLSRAPMAGVPPEWVPSLPDVAAWEQARAREDGAADGREKGVDGSR